ncbi:MAG: ATP-binding protein [Thermotaleaceae bacterium]
MHIAVLSGKGGTGKTTVATNLSKVMGYRYVDCDVEEPNGFIFLKPEILERREVSVPVPHIVPDLCTHCNVCVEICQFKALANTQKEILLFEQMCHGCGACTFVCPAKAIGEKERTIGQIQIGSYQGTECYCGILNLGEPMAGPIISQLKRFSDQQNTIFDCAPGSSCNVVKSIIDCDYALLVTEPTLFGIHDLKIAVELVQQMGIPHGVIINCVESNENIINDYCQKEKISIIGSIPFDKKIAILYSEGKLLVEQTDYHDLFYGIAHRLKGVTQCS